MKRAFVALVLAGCSGAMAPAVSFHVTRVDTTPDGRDVDDAPPSVALAVGARQIPAGSALGTCKTIENSSPLLRETCGAHPPSGTIASLACGDDPWVDALTCFYAVRAGDAIELWRRDATFVVSDDAPPKVSARPLARVGSAPLARR